MKEGVGPRGWQPHVIVSRIDGSVNVDGRVPAFIADMMSTPRTRTNNHSIAAIRAAWSAVSACSAV